MNKQFAPCENCHGTGGISCTLYCVKGRLLVTGGTYGDDVRIQKCSCTSGFSTICEVCQGRKAHVLPTLKATDCQDCDKEPT